MINVSTPEQTRQLIAQEDGEFYDLKFENAENRAEFRANTIEKLAEITYK